jgi:PhnB protein
VNGTGIYLTFNGQCRQALNYYRKCFGGELVVLQIVMKNTIVSAVLINDYFKLVGTDLTGNDGIIIGNNISILIECASGAERSRIRDFLSENKNGRKNGGDNLINVTDKYKVNWILSVK